MSWMIVLVATNLRLACRDGARPSELRGLAVTGALALGVVLAVTRGAYAYPSGSTFTDLVGEKTSEDVLRGVPDGARICIAREPYDLLWAAPFHGARRYVVVEAEPTGDSDCANARKLP
jgi:hypothetical protein